MKAKTQKELLKEVEELRTRLKVSEETVRTLQEGNKGALKEIAHLKKANETLAQLASFPELNPNPVMEVDLAGNVHYSNPAVNQLFPDLQTIGFHHPYLSDLSSLTEMSRHQGKSSIIRELKINNCWYEQTIYYVSENNRLRIYGLDITDRKKAEEEHQRLRIESENEKHRLEALMEALPVGVAITDAQGGNIRANKTFDQLWGSPRPVADSVADYIAYKAWWSETGKPITPEEWASAKAVQKGQAVVGQLLEIQRFDGTRASVINSGAPIFDTEGKITGCAVAIQDITELRKAEKALRESEERLRRMIETSPVAIGFGDTTGKIFEANESFYQLTGYTREEIQARQLGWNQLMAPEYAELDRQIMTTLAATGSAGPYEKEYIRKDGSRVPLLLSVSKFPGRDEHIAFIVDITERKKMEDALRKSNERLDILSETSSRLLASEHPQEIVNELCEKVMTFLDCHAFFNYLVDEEKQRLHLNAYAGIPEEVGKEIGWLDYGVAVCGCAAQDASRIVCENIPTTPDPRTDLVKSFGIKAYACHPLMSRGRVIGTLSFGTRSRLYFSEEELALMKTVADQVAIAMERMQLYENAKRRADELDAVFDSMTEAVLIYDRDGLPIKANRAMASYFGYQPTDEKDLYKDFRKVIEKLSIRHPDGRRFTPGEVPSQRALRGERTVGIPAVFTDTQGQDHTALASAAPLLLDGNVSGAVAIWADVTERERLLEQIRRSRDELEFRVQERTAELAKANKELRGEIAVRQRTEEALRKLTYDLGKRVKEAKCLYSISYYIGRRYSQLEDKLRDIVAQIPSGWQYPEITCAQIVLEGAEYKTDNFKETNWRQASDIVADDERIGTVEVFYLEERPIADEGPFVEEERNLINSIAIEIGEMIGHMRADEAVKTERQRLNAVLEKLPVYVALLEPDYHIPFANRVFRERFGESHGRRCFESMFERSEPCEICETYTVLKTMAPHEWEWTGPDGRDYQVFDLPFTDTDGSTLILEMGIDVTERKQAEEALKAAHQYNRNLIEVSLDPLVTISPEGKVTDVNTATEQVTGFPRKELIGTDFSNYFTEPDKAREGYQQVFSKGSVRDYPLAIQQSSGHITDVLYNATVYRNEAGEVQGVFAAARDITELKRTQDALRAASLYTRSLIEASLDPLVTISPEGKVTDVNTATEQVTGLSRDELIGTDFSDYFTEHEKAREGYQRVFREGLVRDFPLAIQQSSGRITDVLYNATVYRNEAGEVQGVFAAARDITELKRTQDALRAASLYTRSLIEASLDPLVTISPEGKIMDVNYATELTTGIPRDELIGTDFSDYFTEPEKAREGYQRVYREGFVKDFPLVIRGPSGKMTDVLYHATLFKNEAGEIQGVFAAARDITTRKQAEEALKESESRLRSLSSQLLTVQENERKRVARELHDGIGQLLTAIKFKVENILQEKEEGKTGAKEKSFEDIIPMIKESIEEVRRIQMDLRPSILDDLGILATIKWFCREFEKIYSTIRIRIEVQVEENQVAIQLKTVIFRVTQEALNNISKHSKANLVRLSLEKKEDRIELAIEDNGIGFNLERAQKGFGLGSMRERTELSGGSFFLESRAGKGTTIKASWSI